MGVITIVNLQSFDKVPGWIIWPCLIAYWMLVLTVFLPFILIAVLIGTDHDPSTDSVVRDYDREPGR
jgi:hypothetical protein